MTPFVSENVYTIGDESLAFLNFEFSTNFLFLIVYVFLLGGGGEEMFFPWKINKNSVIKVIVGKLTINYYAPVTKGLT